MITPHSSPSGGPDLLEDALWSIATASGVQRCTLPALLAGLLTDAGILELPRLAADQHGHVWRFLVRTASQVLHDLGDGVPDVQADTSVLAGRLEATLRARVAAPSAFRLYHPVHTEPAFLQPPAVRGESLEEAGYRADTVARLSVLMGGKTHERKPDVERVLDAEAIVYALITFQSGVIYTKGNYASQLMGSATGKGSGTPFMGVRLGGALERTFRHDVGVVLRQWGDVARERGLRGQLWALWTAPWSGNDSLGSEVLSPAFIPCARLVRLGPPRDDGVFSTIWFQSTKCARIDDRTEGTGLGDIFVPQIPHPNRAGDVKVRGTMGSGYRYDEVVRLLFGGEDGTGRPAPTVVALLDERDVGTVQVLFEGMAFDQGKTLGFHRREVLLPEGNLLDLREPDVLRETHGHLLRAVKDAQSALRGATRILLNGSPRPRTGDAVKVDLGAQALQQAIDACYIDRLLYAARRRREADETVMAEWRQTLHHLTLEAFAATRDLIPIPTTRRLQREVEADAFLHRKLAAQLIDSSTT